MKYSCATENGRHFAVIESDDGDELSRKEAPSKFEAMTLRDAARNAGVRSFDDAERPPVQSGPTELKAPKETEPAPEPQIFETSGTWTKPKRVRKPKAKK